MSAGSTSMIFSEEYRMGRRVKGPFCVKAAKVNLGASATKEGADVMGQRNGRVSSSMFDESLPAGMCRDDDQQFFLTYYFTYILFEIIPLKTELVDH